MIRIYADTVLAYDSRLEEYDLKGLTLTRGLNTGGAAEITLPPGHPAYRLFTEYKTLVTIYDGPDLRFRGRPIEVPGDYYLLRRITCEGEMCFLRDGVSRPYLYQDSPENIFKAVMQVYNSQVEPVKQFQVGEITVTDPNDYVRLESESAEPVLDTVNKLLERCGGYIVFEGDADHRTINWRSELNQRSTQKIEFGENLMDFNIGAGNDTTPPATALIPYGAKDEETGERVTIESVNGGLDYIVAADARALRGTIMTTQTWDDVTEPAILLRKAQAYLEERKNLITSITLTALDLSLLDKSIDRFDVGDRIRVHSIPHGVDADFQLTQMTENLLDPSGSSITLGKEYKTLTGSDVAGDYEARSELSKVKKEIKADYQLNIANAVQASEYVLASLIQQTSDLLLLQVSQEYTSNGELEEAISSTMTQLSDQFLFEFEKLSAVVDENNTGANEKFTEIYNYISFEDGNIRLGGSDSPITLTIEKELIVFKNNGEPFGWWDGVDFHTGNIVVEVNERAQFGHFAFVPRSNGSLSFLKVGG